MTYKILLVEDEENIRKFTKINLERAGFKVLEAATGEEGLEVARAEKPHVCILDIMLGPGIDGYEVCRHLRSERPDVGIIMLTAKSQDVDKILGLEQGTDDYMIKPFNPKELILRIQSLIRRLNLTETADVQEESISDGPFTLNLYSRTFTKKDKVIELTPTELSIIHFFMKEPGRAFTRAEILEQNWDKNYHGDTKIVDVNIRRIRTKIEDDPAHPTYLETVWGVGYRWKV